MRWGGFFILVLLCSNAFARVEILFPRIGHQGHKEGSCTWVKLVVPGPHHTDLSLDLTSQSRLIDATRKQVRDTYRALGTANEAELDHMLKEDENFPAASVLYLRSISDTDGKVEGIMRVVTTDQATDTYYNFVLTDVAEPGRAKIPLYHNYPNPEFHEYLAKEFPRPTEFGKLVFGEGVNKIRVLNDLVVAANQMIYFPLAKKYNPDSHFVLAEAVPDAVHLYEQYGLKIEEAPIKFDNGRVLMQVNVRQFYDKFVGAILEAKNKFELIPIGDTVAAKAGIEEFDRAINNVSPSIAVRKTFNFGIFHRAVAKFQMNDFAGMLTDVQLLQRHDPQNKEYRLLEAFAQAGKRCNLDSGVGDYQKAIEYLDSAEAKARFADSELPEAVYPEVRLFLKGRVYIAAGKYAEAKKIREEIDQTHIDRDVEAHKRGWRSQHTPQALYGAMRVEAMRHLAYDPATGIGSTAEAATQVEIHEYEGTAGLTSQLFDYKVKVLTARGDLAGAAKAKEIADGLR